MSITRRPSSLEGIKRLAKQIKLDEQIAHTAALDEAAKQAGYQNFNHARKHFGLNSSTPVAEKRFYSLSEFQTENLERWGQVVGRVNPQYASKLIWSEASPIRGALRSFMGSNLNHAFLPTGGGMDFKNVVLSREPGCIEFEIEENYAYIVKPNRLSLETIDGHLGESFLLLELSPMIKSGAYEYLAEDEDEDVRRRYHQWRKEELVDVDGMYLERYHWDQDSMLDENGDEVRLPETARRVVRWLDGKMLIVAKGSRWNADSSTYDGRHDKMSSEQIRHVISSAIDN